MKTLVGRRALSGGGFETIQVEIDGTLIGSVRVWPGDDPALPLLCPGWIDLQCNGALGRDFSDPEGDFAGVAAFLAGTGVTAYLATVVTAPPESYPSILTHLTELRGEGGATFLGAHLEGPFLSHKYPGAHNPDWLRGFDDPLTESLAVEPVRMITLAPEMEGGEAACTRFRERGIVVAAGHSAAGYREALKAFEAGVGAGTHLFNAMPPLHHREPGLAGALLQRTSPPTGLIADGWHVRPAMVSLAWTARGPEGIFLVTDAIPTVGLPPGDYRIYGQRVLVSSKDARLTDGRLAGSMLGMNLAVANVASWTGDLHGALRAASETPARVLGLGDSKGRIEPGFDADLVLLDDDFNVLETVVAGETVYRADLDSAPVP